MFWFIDAGHGGVTINDWYVTPGKRSPEPPPIGIYEGEYNRAVVKKIIEIGSDLMIQPVVGNCVADISIKQRVDFVNDCIKQVQQEYKPCMLLSIHADAMGNGSEWTEHTGFKGLHYPNSTKGIAFAEMLLNEAEKCLPYPNLGLRPRDDLGILKGTSCPAVLWETGHMTNQFDVASLRTNAGQHVIAEIAVKAMRRYESENA